MALNTKYRELGLADVALIEQTQAYKGFFKIEQYQLRHRYYSGEMSTPMSRELFVRGQSVGVLLYDPAQDCVALAKQFRIGCLNNPQGPWVWEVVAGILGSDEEPKAACTREVAEETGLAIHENNLTPITSYYSSPGGSDELLHLYLGCVALPDSVEGVYGLEEEHENILVRRFARKDALSMLRDGQINNAATIIALQWLELNRDRFA